MKGTMSESNTIAGHVKDAREIRRLYPEGWEPTWLLQGLTQAGAINLIMGPPKSHKSQLRRYLTGCILTGNSAFGEFPASVEAPRVLSMVIEDHVGTEADRVNTVVRALGFTALEEWADPAPLLLYDTKDLPFNLLSSRCVTDIIEYMRLEGVNVLSIDPFVMFHSADENKANEMSVVMESLHTIVAKTAAGIILVHHTAKPGEMSGQRTVGERARGSSAVPGAIQSAILVERLNRAGYVHKLSFEMKCAEPIPPMRVDFEWNTGLWMPEDSGAVESDLREKIQAALREHPGQYRDDLVKSLGVRASYARSIIRSMEKEGILEVRLGSSRSRGRPPHLIYLK